MIEKNKEVIEFRVSTCKSCPELTKVKTCKKCGCFMPAKVRLASASCPLGKWGKTEKKVYKNIPVKHLNK